MTNFNEYLNEECYNDRYEIPTLEELKSLQNGKPDNFLTGKKLSVIFNYLYVESDYQMNLSIEELKVKGYTLMTNTNSNIVTICFEDNSTLSFSTFTNLC